MNRKFWRRVWQVARWPLGVILVLYVGIVLYRIPHFAELDRTQQTVAQIHAQKLTLDDVMGKNLPPPLDPAKADATIAGIDANHNGIRDDVEWAIFNRYPNSARIRAAELQYAMALQNELTNVFSSGTFVAAAQEEGRGSQCISDSTPDKRNLSQTLAAIQSYEKEVEDFVFNTTLRKEKHQNIFDRYAISYASLNGTHCNIDLKSLPN